MSEEEAIAALATMLRLQRRLQEGEPLRLLVGLGANASEIGLADSYVDGIRADLLKSIAFRIGEVRSGMAAGASS